MAFYSYLSTKIIMAFITKSYQDLFGVRSHINAKFIPILNDFCSIGTRLFRNFAQVEIIRNTIKT